MCIISYADLLIITGPGTASARNLLLPFNHCYVWHCHQCDPSLFALSRLLPTMSNAESNEASQRAKRATPDTDAVRSPWTPCPPMFHPDKRLCSNGDLERTMTSDAAAATATASLADSITTSTTTPFDASQSTEFFTARHAAQLRLSSARRTSRECAASLKAARDRFVRSQAEVREAREFFEGVERRWGVVDVDAEAESESEATSSVAVSDSFGASRALELESSDGNSSSRTPSPSLSLSATSSLVRIDNDYAVDKSSIEAHDGTPEADWNRGTPRPRYVVRNAGDVIVHGTYHLCQHGNDDRTNGGGGHFPNDAVAVPCYVSSIGPIPCPRQQLRDVCLFRKDGYGDKVRWCLALVPRVPMVTGDDPTTMNDRRWGWDFALAYIYYWVEIPIVTANAREPPVDGWRACHGRGPPPRVEPAGGGDGDGDGRSGGWWTRLRRCVETWIEEAGEV